MEGLSTKALFSLENTIAYNLLSKTIYPWEAIPKIHNFILLLAETLDVKEYERVGESVYISKRAKVDNNAKIEGPCVICANAELRQGAFIRGNSIIGEKCVIGNSSEIKNSILFNGAQVPHFNYVGDSILGFRAHLGAGAKISNLKSDKSNVAIATNDTKIETGFKKLGAVLGDNVEVGCNCVLNPGTIVGKNTTIYPLSSVRGYIEENSIYKNENCIVKKQLL